MTEEKQPAAPAEPTSVDEAKKIVEELREQNAILQKNLERAERLEAQSIIHGRAEGGADKKPKELTDEEYSKKVLAGEIP